MIIITIWYNEQGEQMYTVHEPGDSANLAKEVTNDYMLRALAVRTEEGKVCSGWHIGKEVCSTDEAYGSE